MILGAVLGAIFGFMISELKSYCVRKREARITNRKIKPYVGMYSVTTKSGAESLLLSVQIEHKVGNILNLDLNSKTNGPAEGVLVLDPYTHSFGRAYYHHTNEDKAHLSGSYDIQLIEDGLIHATVSYRKASTRQEINEIYVWKLNS